MPEETRNAIREGFTNYNKKGRKYVERFRRAER
jgi:hypothetical protein